MAIRRKLWGKRASSLFPLVAVLIASMVIPLPAAHAADHSFSVNIFSDAVDANIGNGQCKDARGHCTLRAAVQEAGALGGVTNITLVNPGTYTLTITGPDEDRGATGDLDILSSINLYAPPVSGNATVTGKSGFGDRIFDIPAGSPDMSVTFQPRLIISSGTAPAGEDGGGIRSINAGSLFLNQMTVSGNTARNGGGVYVTGAAGSSLQTNTAIIIGNTAISSGGGLDVEGAVAADFVRLTAEHNHAANGGGLAAFLSAGSTGSTTSRGQGELNDNSATGSGGGMAVSRFTGVDFDVTGNSATNGGGVALSGTNGPSNIDGRVHILDNRASLHGGGVFGDCAEPCGLLGQTTIQGNVAASDGGGMYLTGALTFDRGLIHSNSAGGTTGGALFHAGRQTLVMTNATVADNESAATGAATSGGVVVEATVADSYTNDTIAWNTGGSVNGVLVTGPGAVPPEVKNTIVADTITGTSLCKKALTSFGHNIDSGQSCGFHAQGDMVNTDPGINPVSDNGGGVHSMALKTGVRSVAIDAGDNTGCTDTDTRWVRRPQDGDGNLSEVCDIGAYEVSSTTANSQIVISVTPSVTDPKPGDSLTYTMTFVNKGAWPSINSWVIDALPAQLSLLSCQGTDVTCDLEGNTATLTFPSIGFTHVPTMTVVARVRRNVPRATVITNAAVTWADNPDSDHPNNTGYATIIVS